MGKTRARRRKGISEPVFLLRQLGDPERVRADRSAGVPDDRAGQLYLVRGSAEGRDDDVLSVPMGPQLCKSDRVQRHDGQHAVSVQSRRGHHPA